MYTAKPRYGSPTNDPSLSGLQSPVRLSNKSLEFCEKSEMSSSMVGAFSSPQYEISEENPILLVVYHSHSLILILRDTKYIFRILIFFVFGQVCDIPRT